jgi:hypothetical protein
MPRTCAIALALLTMTACTTERPPPAQPRPAPATPSQPQPRPAPDPAPTPPPLQQPVQPPPPTSQLRELFPGIRANLDEKFIEFDGTVPIDAHHPQTPHVYLEVIVCTPDTKEHEALVVTDARPSNIHAALLAIGLQPGEPSSWKWEDESLTAIPPRGSPVRITFLHTSENGRRVESPAESWITSVEGARLPEREGFLFAGSRVRFPNGERIYEADRAGTLIGLATFGSETIAWSSVFSPDSAVDEPEWIADTARVPRYGTEITVRIRAETKNPAPAP